MKTDFKKKYNFFDWLLANYFFPPPPPSKKKSHTKALNSLYVIFPTKANKNCRFPSAFHLEIKRKNKFPGKKICPRTEKRI